ncbi:MAG: helix-turn-helix domain-containing protein [Balneolales bacterium]
MSKISQDLLLIRRNMRLSKQNIFEKCRIPIATIEAIEDGSIYTGKMRNKTYLRSYFRTYAKAVGINDDDMINALDQVEEGTYAGHLAEIYLSRDDDVSTDNDKQSGRQAKDPVDKGKPSDKLKDPEAPGDTSGSKKSSGDQSTSSNDADKQIATGKKTPASADTDRVKSPASTSRKTENKGAPSSGSSSSGPASKKKIITPESQEKSVDDIEWEDEHTKKPLATSTSDYASSESHDKATIESKFPDPPEMSSVDWARKIKEAVYRPQRNRIVWVMIVILLALALAAAAIFWFWQQNRSNGAIETSVENTISPALSENDEDRTDQSNEGETAASVLPNISENISIDIAEMLPASGPGDTLFVVVYALNGNLEPIRVDSDVFGQDTTTAFRPYWVENQEAMRFDFINEIAFQGALSRMVLLFNGHLIDNFNALNPDGPRIRLTRNYIQENELLQTPAVSPFSEVPPPEAINDRPRFSP